MTDAGPEPRALVVGAGLAGCECALQAASLGLLVDLAEQKPGRRSPAHHSDGLAELVCSNSFKSMQPSSASGIQKEELFRMGSILLRVARETAVPAGNALAVDRTLFSEQVTHRIRTHPRIRLVEERISDLPDDRPVVIATGPLTDGPLYDRIQELTDSPSLHFFDAAAPLVRADTIDRTLAYAASRYGKGGDDYLNCPMDRDTYDAFVRELLSARLAPVQGADEGTVFEGCMPVETMAARGPETLRHGPMKPVGLPNPSTGRIPHAVVQLRQDDRAASLYGLVGFQTRLAYPEQDRVFRMIPGLGRAVFERYGVMHRNTYLAPDGLLDHDCQLRPDRMRIVRRYPLLFAGQITGVEGYVESIASGLVAGWSLAFLAHGLRLPVLPSTTLTGALQAYLSHPSSGSSLSPMNANLGLLPPLAEAHWKKADRHAALAERAMADLDRFLAQLSSTLDWFSMTNGRGSEAVR